jgi:hypothetical protein
VKSSRNMTTLTARAYSTATHPVAALLLRFQGKSSGDNDPPERGDVAAWVLITLLSAVLAAALLVLTGPALGTVQPDLDTAVARTPTLNGPQVPTN